MRKILAAGFSRIADIIPAAVALMTYARSADGVQSGATSRSLQTIATERI